MKTPYSAGMGAVGQRKADTVLTKLHSHLIIPSN